MTKVTKGLGSFRRDFFSPLGDSVCGSTRALDVRRTFSSDG